MPTEEMQQLATLRVRIHTILSAPFGPSQILVHDEGDGQLQLAEQLIGTTGYSLPVYGPVPFLFFCEDLAEAQLQLVDLHARILMQQRRRVLNLD
jgi:hypothetical protein